ncbi:MAG: DUF2232 domain-containing protein [Halanaerobiales bacterium]
MLNQRIKDSIKVLIYLLILTLINIYIPFLSILVLIIWPIPIAVIIMKYDLNTTAGVIAISALINGLLFSPLMGLLAVIGYGLVGFVIGTCLKENIKPIKTLIFTVLSVIFSYILLLSISKYLLGINLQSIINEINTILGQAGNMGNMEEMIKNQLQLLQRIFPALIVISAIITGSLNYYVTTWYINKAGFDKPTFKDIKYWALPRWFIAVGIVISLILKRYLFFVNLNMVLLFLTLIQGYAVIMYYIDKKTKNTIIKVIFTGLVLFIPLLPPAIIVLGLVDFWFDLRKLKNYEEKN